MTQREPHRDRGSEVSTGRGRPLYLILGAARCSPCDQETYADFKLWVARTLAAGAIDCYSAGGIWIAHWGEEACGAYPNLLNPCECGTFLPIDVEPGPMLGSAMGLLSDLHRLKSAAEPIPARFGPLLEALMEMAERSIATNTPLEIR